MKKLILIAVAALLPAVAQAAPHHHGPHGPKGHPAAHHGHHCKPAPRLKKHKPHKHHCKPAPCHGHHHCPPPAPCPPHGHHHCPPPAPHGHSHFSISVSL
ncbi:MAG: hypothetical protein IJ503_02060 [Akkermansia sp.]|nr:hypothetical protein [Akkermansia sp.]